MRGRSRVAPSATGCSKQPPCGSRRRLNAVRGRRVLAVLALVQALCVWPGLCRGGPSLAPAPAVVKTCGRIGDDPPPQARLERARGLPLALRYTRRGFDGGGGIKPA